MNKYSSIIVDDEKHGRDNLRILLQNYCPQINVIGESASVTEAKELIEDMQPQIVFLDILMPGSNGFDLLDLFPERSFVVVFVSASNDFGIRAVKAGVLDYLLKPVNIQELEEVVIKIESHFNSALNKVYSSKDPVNKIVLSQMSGFAIESFENIVCLKAENNYTSVQTKSGKRYLVSRPMKDFERVLPPDMFLRTHKSYIININHLKDFNNYAGGTAVLSDGVEVPVSKRREPVFFNMLRKFSLMVRS